MNKKIIPVITALILAGSLAACGNSSTETTVAENTAQAEASVTRTSVKTVSSDGNLVTAASVTSTGMINAADLFTQRDLTQTADLSEAVTYILSDGQDITITEEGTYVLTGTASNVTVYVEAQDGDKVQLVLDGVSITNDSFPCIYVKNADKVFVTSTDSKNSLSVTGTFREDGDTKTDAVIFAKDDLVLNGIGSVEISSTDNAVSCKNDLKVTGGTWNISCTDCALEAKESISVADGTINITACNDGLHAEDDDDNSQGQIYICGGSLTIQAADDAIHATTILQVDGGALDLTGAEGMEGTSIQINDGTIRISATDDGINAANKSGSYTTIVEFNGGTTTIAMGQGDTDGVDSNGDIVVNGGTVDVSGQSTFDYDGNGTVNGGTVIENGTETNTLTSQMMGGGGHGGRGGFGH